VPKAFVTLKPGRTLTAEALVAHCRSRLAGFKVPKAVEFGELPKTSTGKVQKFVLRTGSGRDATSGSTESDSHIQQTGIRELRATLGRVLRRVQGAASACGLLVASPA